MLRRPAIELLAGAAPISLTPAAIALLSDPGKEQAAVVERVLRPYLMHLNQIVERLIDINDHIEDTEVCHSTSRAFDQADFQKGCCSQAPLIPAAQTNTAMELCTPD